MSRHTPGPWETDGFWVDTVPGREDMQTNFGAPGITDEEIEANAYLIAAAPDLLRELRHLVALLEPLEDDGTLAVPGLATLNGARAAIARATEGDA